MARQHISEYHRRVAEAQAQIVSEELDQHRWNVRRTAESLGISRRFMLDLIADLGLRPLVDAGRAAVHSAQDGTQ